MTCLVYLDGRDEYGCSPESETLSRTHFSEAKYITTKLSLRKLYQGLDISGEWGGSYNIGRVDEVFLLIALSLVYQDVS